jgi:hypothetical protein
VDARTEADALAARVRASLAVDLFTEQRMFGGVAFLLGGNMLCCASRKGLMVRVGREAEAAALSRPFAAPCLGAGRPMPGFIMVEPRGLASDAQLDGWVDLAKAYVLALPPKSAGKARASSRGPRATKAGASR